MFWSGVNLSLDLVAVTGEHVFHDGNQIGIDLGVTGSVLLVKVHEIRRNNVHAVSTQPCAQAYHGDRQHLCQILVYFLRGDFTHE